MTTQLEHLTLLLGGRNNNNVRTILIKILSEIEEGKITVLNPKERLQLRKVKLIEKILESRLIFHLLLAI